MEGVISSHLLSIGGSPKPLFLKLLWRLTENQEKSIRLQINHILYKKVSCNENFELY